MKDIELKTISNLNNVKVSNVKLNLCLDRLKENSKTHPQLTTLWYNYLLTNKLNEQDVSGCFKAIENMNNIPDISIEQIMIFKEIIKFLCDNDNNNDNDNNINNDIIN
jgi:hypothetical protein